MGGVQVACHFERASLYEGLSGSALRSEISVADPWLLCRPRSSRRQAGPLPDGRVQAQIRRRRVAQHPLRPSRPPTTGERTRTLRWPSYRRDGTSATSIRRWRSAVAGGTRGPAFGSGSRRSAARLRVRPRSTCLRLGSMASWTTRKPTGGVMALTRVCIYTRISTDEENQPDLAPLAARTAGGVLEGTGGLADRRPQARPGNRHQGRPARPASSTRPRARRRDRHAARLPSRPAEAEGASARATHGGTWRARRGAALGDGAV
jgi:hypothetical protein